MKHPISDNDTLEAMEEITVSDLAQECEELRARLAAAEKVVSAARIITSPHGPVTGSRDWEMAWHQLEDALAAYQEMSDGR